MKKPLPIGVDNFEKIIKERYCYVDKTGLIKKRHICGHLKSTPL